MRVLLVDCSCYPQEVLEQVEQVMTSALILEVRRRDCQSVDRWRAC
jgi:hypothetical protein